MAASEWQTIEVEVKEEHRTHLSYFCDHPQNGMDLFSTDVARARTASDTTSEAAAMPRGKQREKVGGRERARDCKFCSKRIFFWLYFSSGW